MGQEKKLASDLAWLIAYEEYEGGEQYSGWSPAFIWTVTILTAIGIGFMALVS